MAKKNTTMEDLDFGGNMLVTDGMSNLAHGLTHNESLKILALPDWNRAPAQGLAILGECLVRNNS
jgi:hypothetical protein